MRKTLWIPAVAAAVTAVTLSGLLVAQPADTKVPPPSNVPAGGMNAAAATTGPAPTTQEILTQASYAIGFDMGKNMKEQDFQLDLANFTSGLQDSLAGTPSKLSDDQVQKVMQTLQEQMMAKAEAKQKVLGAKNETEGKAFLEANKSKPGVKTTASGLQYVITTEGTGPLPKASDTVKVNYTGTLIDGTKFDSSIDRGEPLEIPLEGVIPGWTEGLQLFKVGSKGKLFIPGNLAYGEHGSGAKIPPNATLVFDVELISISPPATQPADGAMPGGMPGAQPTQMP